MIFTLNTQVELSPAAFVKVIETATVPALTIVPEAGDCVTGFKAPAHPPITVISDP